MLFANLEIIIQANRLSVRNLDTGETVSADAPFSCSHQLVDAVDILEHACQQLFKRAARTSWSFPRVTVSIPGRALHSIERKVIGDLLKNAGAQRVTFAENNSECGEQLASQLAYVERVKQKR